MDKGEKLLESFARRDDSELLDAYDAGEVVSFVVPFLGDYVIHVMKENLNQDIEDWFYVSADYQDSMIKRIEVLLDHYGDYPPMTPGETADMVVIARSWLAYELLYGVGERYLRKTISRENFSKHLERKKT